MRTVLPLILAAALIAGCAKSKAVVQKPPASPPEAPKTAQSTKTADTPKAGDAPKTADAPEPDVGPDQLATLPAGRFCQVIGSDSRNCYEGTIARATGDELVLTDVMARTVDGIPGLRDLPFQWTRNAFSDVGIAALDGEVKLKRSKIASVHLFEADEGKRRLAQQLDWRAELGRSDSKKRIVLTNHEQFGADF